MTSIDVNSPPPRAPRVLLYIPPSGSPLHCPDMDAAKAAAENYAAERPGVTVGVYQLVGFAYRPVEKPAFQDSESAIAALLPSEPASGVIHREPDEDVEAERPDMTPAQRGQLAVLKAATPRSRRKAML
ncbi:MAG: hypothetical protein PS018_17185 [bacterium]|nr:hypothetical protein [bacterium]